MFSIVFIQWLNGGFSGNERIQPKLKLKIELHSAVIHHGFMHGDEERPISV